VEGREQKRDKSAVKFLSWLFEVGISTIWLESLRWWNSVGACLCVKRRQCYVVLLLRDSFVVRISVVINTSGGGGGSRGLNLVNQAVHLCGGMRGPPPLGSYR
jgi:hypothetical protein